MCEHTVGSFPSSGVTVGRWPLNPPSPPLGWVSGRSDASVIEGGSRRQEQCVLFVCVSCTRVCVLVVRVCVICLCYLCEYFICVCVCVYVVWFPPGSYKCKHALHHLHHLLSFSAPPVTLGNDCIYTSFASVNVFIRSHDHCRRSFVKVIYLFVCKQCNNLCLPLA